MEQPQSARDKCAFLADCVARGQLTTTEALSIACSGTSAASQVSPNQQQPQMNAPSRYMGKTIKYAQPPGVKTLISEI